MFTMFSGCCCQWQAGWLNHGEEGTELLWLDYSLWQQLFWHFKPPCDAQFWLDVNSCNHWNNNRYWKLLHWQASIILQSNDRSISWKAQCCSTMVLVEFHISLLPIDGLKQRLFIRSMNNLWLKYASFPLYFSQILPVIFLFRFSEFISYSDNGLSMPQVDGHLW